MWNDDNQTRFLEELNNKLDIPSRMLEEIPQLPRTTEAVLVYGSRARGDEKVESDLDLLVLSSQGRPNMKSESVSVAIYTLDELDNSNGTLFGYHLQRDAKYIWDPQSELQALIATFKEVDADRVFRRSRHLAKVLTCDSRDVGKYLPGLYREARYLLRSCLYAQAIAEQRPCFSVRALAERYGEPRYSDILSAKPQDSFSKSDYLFCKRQLVSILGELEINEHGSLESLIVNEWGKDTDLISIALMAVGDIKGISDYAEVKAVFL